VPRALPSAFRWPGEPAPARLEEALTGRFSLGRRRRQGVRWTYFDTFDWRLHGAGWRLRGRRRGEGYEVELAAPAERTTRVARAAAAPAFAAELPAGPLRRTLVPVVGNRRLLPRAEVESRGAGWTLVDGEGKTLARLVLEERTALCPDGLRSGAGTAAAGAAATPLPARLRLAPLHGYEEECRPLAQWLGEGLGLAAEPEEELAAALAACGRRPGDYSSGLHVRLHPSSRADAAVVSVLVHLLAAIEANEEGVRRELDPEFLHDFRVAVRRTRAALGQLAGVLPAAVEPFREDFAWLGRVTGPKRDHDVFAADFQGHVAGLPRWAREALEPLAALLAERDRALQAELVAALDSDRYRKLIEGWRRLLEGDPTAAPEASQGARPVSEVAVERISRAARRVRKRAAAVDETTAAAAVHRLRIECKKLRYLLEFFRSLDAAGAVEAEVKALKVLQDVLGEANDLAVQAATVRRLAGDLAPVVPPPPPEALLAAGYLLARLDRRRRKKRRELLRALRDYLKRRRRPWRLLGAEAE
jgi:CHAD domain-containing protein